MSLSRDDWAKMWESLRVMEHVLENPGNLSKAQIQIRILKEIDAMKKQIQSVIGQME